MINAWQTDKKKKDSEITNVGNEKWDIMEDLIAIKMIIEDTVKNFMSINLEV